MKNYLIYLLLFLSFPVFAQSDNLPGFVQSNKFYIDINGGLSLPVGKYGSPELSGGSFTTAGGNIQLSFSWLAKAPFGLRISLQGSIHPVDVTKLGWAKVANDPFLQDVSIRSDPYMPLTALAGFFYEKKLYDRIKVIGGINAGIMKISTPYQLYKPQYFLYGPEYYEITSANDYTFAYQVLMEFEYQVKESWSIVLHSSYNHAAAKFTFWTANETRINKQNISFLLANFGVRLKF